MVESMQIEEEIAVDKTIERVEVEGYIILAKMTDNKEKKKSKKKTKETVLSVVKW